MAKSPARDKDVLTVEPENRKHIRTVAMRCKNENEGMMSEVMCRRQSLVRALDPRFALVLIHSVVGRPLSLPWVGGVKFYVFQGDRFWELLHRVPRRQDGLEKVKLALVKRLGELDAKFDVEVTRFVMSLRRHTLTVDDFQVTWRVSSAEHQYNMT